jgi:integrase
MLELDLVALRKALVRISPATHGLKTKTFQTLKSNLLAAVAASGLFIPGRTVRRTLAPAWLAVWPLLKVKRHRVNLSRLARYCSSNDIDPAAVTDQTMVDFILFLETATLSGKVKDRRRQVPKTWNEICANVPGWPAKPITVPDQRLKSGLVDLTLLPKSFQDDLEGYIAWCGVSDPFDPAARDRRLKPASLESLRHYLRKAVDAAIRSGIELSQLTSLASLVDIETFRKILRTLDLDKKSEPNLQVHHLAKALKVMAREWVKVLPGHLEALQKVIRILPQLPPGLRPKNRELLRTLEDDRVVQRLIDLPTKLWKQAHRLRTRPVKAMLLAQTALQIELLLIVPLRRANLASLSFARHISWPSGNDRPAYLHVPMNETKTERDYEGELPNGLSVMLTTYREKFVPAALGARHDRVFITGKGKPKCQDMVNHQFAKAVWKHVGIRMSVHQMRHVAGKLLLDVLPGGHQIVSDLLGHTGLETARRNYTGMSTARAIRHHGKLIDEMRKGR